MAIKDPAKLLDAKIENTTDIMLQAALEPADGTPPDMRHKPKGNIGTHAFVALLTSLGVFLNWYLVLEKVNNPDAGTLLVLLSTIPVDAMLLNLLGRFTYELWTVPVLEKFIRPKVAALFNKLRLTAVTPAFRSANGLPLYFKEKMNLMLRAIMFEHEVIDLKDELRKLDEIAAGSGLDEIGRKKRTEIAARLAQHEEYLKLLKEKLDPESVPDEKPRLFEHLLKHKVGLSNPHVYTMLASLAGTTSAMLYYFGLPDPNAMENTVNLLIYFFAKAVLVFPIKPLIEDTMVIPVYEYLVRPRLVDSVDKVGAEGVFPSLDGVLGIPPRDRWLYSFDAFIKSVAAVQEKYEIELYLMESKNRLSEREKLRKNDLETILASIKKAMTELHEAMEEIKA